MMMRGSPTNFCATETDCRGSGLAVLEIILDQPPLHADRGVDPVKRQVEAALPLAPYCAFGPVSGPLTPAMIGSARGRRLRAP